MKGFIWSTVVVGIGFLSMLVRADAQEGLIEGLLGSRGGGRTVYGPQEPAGARLLRNYSNSILDTEFGTGPVRIADAPSLPITREDIEAVGRTRALIRSAHDYIWAGLDVDTFVNTVRRRGPLGSATPSSNPTSWIEPAPSKSALGFSGFVRTALRRGLLPAQGRTTQVPPTERHVCGQGCVGPYHPQGRYKEPWVHEKPSLSNFKVGRSRS